MALLGAESFDLYGTSLAALALRGYSIPSVPTLSTGGGRTGVGYFFVSSSGGDAGIGTILDAPVNVIGSGVAIYVTEASGNSADQQGLRFGNTGFADIRINVNNSFGLTVYQGSTERGRSAVNQFVIGSYYWLEAKVTNNTAGGGTGSVEVRLNGNVIIIVNGLDIPQQFQRIGLGRIGASSTNRDTQVRYDDWIWWDTSGTVNNDFMGDRRCFTSYPDADTVEADWVPSSGTEGWSLIDEPVPDDAGYVEAVNPGDISEFEKQPIGIDTNDVAGVVVIARALKTDAGISTFRVGIHSGAFVTNGEEESPNTTPAYFNTIIERDPNGDIPWTRASVDAANLVITRES